MYCPTVLYSVQNNKINKLQKYQNKAMRMLCAVGISSSIILQVHEANNNLLPEFMKEYIVYVRDVHEYDTRPRQDFCGKANNKKNSM